MLVLSRKVDDAIRIGDNVALIITDIRGSQVRLGIKAPNTIRIVRGELVDELNNTPTPADQNAGAQPTSSD